MESGDRWEDRLALGILAVGALALLAPVLFHALAYASFYVACALDPCFSVGL